MAYVQVPRDLSKFESKVAFNLTKRQLICFSIGGLIGIPSYLAMKNYLPPDVCSMITFLIISPFFIMGIFKKDGIPFEKYMYLILRQKYFRPHIRTYKTNNIYEKIVKESGDSIGSTKRNAKEKAKPKH